jgi:hypothetical protein
MRSAIITTGLALVVLAAGRESTAADLKVHRSVKLNEPRTITQIRVYSKSAVAHYGTKTIGMSCMLTPHLIVHLNWNGPQCRYIDNIILPYRSVRYIR